MNEKVQDILGLSVLLIGNKAERPGKHVQLTSAFSLGNTIPHWVYGAGKFPALRTKKQSVRINPLRSHRLYGRQNRNQSALVPWVNPTNTALRKPIWPTAASNEMFASWEIPIKTAGGNVTKGQKHVHQKQHRTGTVLALSSPFVNRETWGKVVTESWRQCHLVVSETTHNPGKYQGISSLLSKGAWMKRFRIFELSALLIGYKEERPGKKSR